MRTLLPLLTCFLGVGCTAAPVCSDPVATFNQPADAAKPLHWALASGCVPTSFDPSFIAHDEYRAMLKSALAAWAAPLDGELCFDPLVDDTTGSLDGVDGTIYVTGAPIPTGEPAVTETFYKKSTGVITKALVKIEILDGKLLETPDFIHLIGLALGLDALPAGSESVMAIPVEYVAPTAHDKTAIHALYDPACKLY